MSALRHTDDGDDDSLRSIDLVSLNGRYDEVKGVEEALTTTGPPPPPEREREREREKTTNVFGVVVLVDSEDDDDDDGLLLGFF